MAGFAHIVMADRGGKCLLSFHFKIGIGLMKRFGVVAVLLAMGIVWGATIPLTKVAVSTGYQPLGLIFWQLIFAVIVLAPIALVRRLISGPARQPTLNSQTFVYFLVIILLGTLIPNSFSYLSIAQLPAGVASIVIASVPMFTLVIALALRIEKPVVARILGVLAGAVAVVLLIGPKASLPDPEKAIYVLVALLAPVSYGFEASYIALRAPKHLDPVTTLLGASVLGLFIVGPLAYFTGSWIDLNIAWQAPEWALFASSVMHAFAYTGYIWLVGIAGVVFASQIAYVVTIAGVLISAIALNETYSTWVWAALAIMLVGMVLVQPRKTTLQPVKENP